MTELPICAKLRMHARTGRDRRSNVAINGYHAEVFDEAAQVIETLVEALEDARPFLALLVRRLGPDREVGVALTKMDSALSCVRPNPIEDRKP